MTSLRVGVQLGARTKTLNVTGDRVWDGRQASPPAPFVTTPLDWEHAYGGAKFADNPLGMAADLAGAELAPLLASQGTSIEDMRAKRKEKPKGPPAFSAAAMRAELQAAVAQFRGIGAEAAELEAQLSDPDTQAR